MKAATLTFPIPVGAIQFISDPESRLQAEGRCKRDPSKTVSLFIVDERKSWAITTAKSGDYRGCSLADLEYIVTVTGSKSAIRERRRRIDAMGPYSKDKHGALL